MKRKSKKIFPRRKRRFERRVKDLNEFWRLFSKFACVLDTWDFVFASPYHISDYSYKAAGGVDRRKRKRSEAAVASGCGVETAPHFAGHWNGRRLGTTDNSVPTTCLPDSKLQKKDPNLLPMYDRPLAVPNMYRNTYCI